jgi:hypothetical protein
VARESFSIAGKVIVMFNAVYYLLYPRWLPTPIDIVGLLL